MSTQVQHREFRGSVLSSTLLYGGVSCLVVGAGLSLVTFATDSVRFWHNFLIMYMFLLSLGLGALFYVALEYLVGAFWSVPIRRVTESMAGTLPFVLILALIIFFGGMKSLYHHWLPHHDHGTHVEASHGESSHSSDSHVKAEASHKTEQSGHAADAHGGDGHGAEASHDSHGSDPIIEGKRPYLNKTSFLIRIILCFGIWILSYLWFVGNSRKQDANGDTKYTMLNIRLSAPFMLAFAATISIASIDWMMSLEPHWFSTMFGVYYFAGTLVSAASVLTILIVKLKEGGYLHPSLHKDTYYNLGLMMFAFNTFWAYIAFSQFMLIWYANLPEETMWFLHRYEGGWVYVSWFMILFHFAIPFFGLLSREQKKNPNRLLFMAIWLLAAHYLDLYWIVMPAYSTGGGYFHLWDIGFILFAAGFVMTLFRFNASKASMVPAKDPKLDFGLEFRAH